jgi:hypothetical protein
MTVLNFGKYRGQPINGVPSGYLCWVLDNVVSLDPYLRARIKAELADRYQLPPRPCSRCEKLRLRWRNIYQKLALLLHPDRGGSHEAMILINELNELVTCDDF